MASSNPVVTGLTGYLDQQARQDLLMKSILDCKSASLMTLQGDVKCETALHILNTDVTLQADGCGWNEAGTSTLSNRTIKPAALKVNQGWCQKKLRDTWASHKIRMAANAQVLPFEEQFVLDLERGIQEKIEGMVWKGDSTNTNECDGLIKILDAATGVIVDTNAAGTSAYNRLKGVYNHMPARIVNKEDAVIFCSEADYREFIQTLVAANMYHYDAKYGDGVYLLPGTNVRVIAVAGLDGSDTGKADRMVGGRLSNFFYGTDVMSDPEAVDFFYDQSEQEFRAAIAFTVGVQVAFPNEVVMGKQV